MSSQVAPCRDCQLDTLSLEFGVDTEYYVVHDELWRRAGMAERGHLCIGCLERRLGRRLIPADFTDAPINNPTTPPTPRYAWSCRTQRLQDRLTGAGLPDPAQLTLF